MEAFDSQKCFEEFQESKYDPEWLASFLKEYPAAHELSWVKNQISKFFENGNWGAIKKLTPGPGERKNEPPLKKRHIDFLIFDKITGLLKKGYSLTGENGCFRTIEKTGITVGNEILGIAFEQIKKRYYRYKNTKPAIFIEDGKIICGPTRIDFPINGKIVKIIGFWTFTPEKSEN